MIPEILQYGFMQKALLAGLFGGSSCAVVGVLVVTMRISSIGICMAHAAFAGALFGMLLNINCLAMAFGFSLATAIVIGPLADRGGFAPETSIGIIFSIMLGLAFLFIGLMSGARTEALSLFWGSILTVTNLDVLFLTIVTALLIICLSLFFQEIRAVLCHRLTALAVGIPATMVYYMILFFVGTTVTASLRSIGGLLIYSLIINPAAAAYQLTYSLKRLFCLAALFGVASCWGGLYASYVFDIPSGATIVIFSTIIFTICTIFSPKKRTASVESDTSEGQAAEGKERKAAFSLQNR
jgi:manganese/iron transport system permease protein